MADTTAVSGLSREVILILGSGIGIGIIAALIAIVKKLREWLTKKLTDVFFHRYPAKKDAEQNREIYTELVELRVMVDGDRCHIFRFHNGEEFLPSSPVWKSTCTHEVVTRGVTYESGHLQSILVSKIHHIIEPLVIGSTSTSGIYVVDCRECPFKERCLKENKRVIVIQVDELPNSYERFHLESKNIKTMLISSLARNGNVFGMVGIDYCGVKLTDEARLRQIATRLCRTSERIQYVIQSRKVPSDAIIAPSRMD